MKSSKVHSGIKSQLTLIDIDRVIPISSNSQTKKVVKVDHWRYNWKNTSKYNPHQGTKECLRRIYAANNPH